jgi:D-alanine-D-alanine ligase
VSEAFQDLGKSCTLLRRMIDIAIIAGGPSAERGISLKSAGTIAKHLPADKYRSTTIDFSSGNWTCIDTGHTVDLNSFCLVNEKGAVMRKFDFAFIIIHGTPAEDGKLQGYFEMKDIPHNACGVLASALTFNKQRCKYYLNQFGIPLAESMLITAPTNRDDVESRQIRPPFFVKPNNNGSSYGVSKVSEWSKLDEAVRLALEYDHEVMIERALVGREFSCGVVREGDLLHVFPVTEIVPKGEFFDYAAKYEGQSEEITPARLETAMSDRCRELSGRLYRLLGCRGMVRFDYILEDGEFYLLEANTTPGMSEASIIPQQAQAYGWTIGQLLDKVVTDCLANPH